ncbi:unnamed protein product, partial [Vitis vinifera]
MHIICYCIQIWLLKGSREVSGGHYTFNKLHGHINILFDHLDLTYIFFWVRFDVSYASPAQPTR